MYGVPELYKDLLNGIIQQVDLLEHTEGEVSGSNMIFSDSFINENKVE